MGRHRAEELVDGRDDGIAGRLRDDRCGGEKHDARNSRGQRESMHWQLRVWGGGRDAMTESVTFGPTTIRPEWSMLNALALQLIFSRGPMRRFARARRASAA
jgi:hypothetical protein